MGQLFLARADLLLRYLMLVGDPKMYVDLLDLEGPY